MRFCTGLLLNPAVFLLAGCLCAQDSASSPPPSMPAAASIDLKPIDPKPSDLKPVDLKPDASGAVPAGQIRELLQRAEEKDLENDKRQRNYTYVERVERHTLDGR